MTQMRALELWGGHECTVNAVGEQVFDQTRLSGHQDRIGDLDLFGGLGFKRLRYPVLWERVAPEHPEDQDWRWIDARLARLRELGIPPIVGLIHHGAGPAYTSLLDEGFAPGLAAHAAAAASRYPWVTDWTPVNEPLTTARFSALYGLWRPHARDERLFWLALLNQIDATRLAMREIRLLIPTARLIQTEDFGETYCTAPLTDQAAFDNTRRWMTWDLLEGRVTPDHPFWKRLSDFGFEGRLRAIADDPSPPDVIGLNHYLTSDRFLDHRRERYPNSSRGGNGRETYADIEAVRVLQPGPGGIAGALDAVWKRYRRAIAITEVHNGCTREEQARWLAEAWQAALDMRARGGQVEAVTVWALLGAHNWNVLLTGEGGYEPGAFDTRAPKPRPTALAEVARSLASGAALPQSALGEGWWRRDVRLRHPPTFRSPEACNPAPTRRAAERATKPILITGATGTLGQALARACEWRGIDYVLTDRKRVPLDEPDSTRQTVASVNPWLVINAAGFVKVDGAEREVDACMATNTTGAVTLARVCRDRNLPYVTFSSDLVFDGASERPYVESDAPRPLNVYGASKQAMEAEVADLSGRALVVRTSAFFSPFDPYNFAAHVRRLASRGEPIEAADDLFISPTYVPHLTEAVLDLAMDGEGGIWHLANDGRVSWAEFARLILSATGGDAALVRGRPACSFHWAARRPRNVALASERGSVMPSLEAGIARYAIDL